ncbi:PKD domain-containing protein [Halorientalis litorea]|uniref:PKD domain-containing protein n=1 Tax=Halorientalis litorea TaxID=2931977 RepID=UPI001FF1369D|nr:PKD domain-containing protein [Halorientalis litorea]
MHKAVLSAAVAVMLLAGVVGGATANESPLADAGLDQSAETGETVRLDASGSRDPDGSISSYRWEIERPDGATTTPDCAGCAATTFTPTRGGQYNLTVTVTDDDGATQSDTLYVTVNNTTTATSEGPSVSLGGPDTPRIGRPASYTATVSAGDVPPDEIAWYVDGRRVGSRSLDDGGQTTRQHTFSRPTTQVVRVNVTDTAGRTATATLSVSPRQFGTDEGDDGGGGGNPGDYYDPQASGGQGAWIDTTRDAEGNMVAESQDGRTEADAINYIQNNGVASNTYSNPGDSPTTSDVNGAVGENDLPTTADGYNDDSNYDRGGRDGGGGEETYSAGGVEFSL